MPRRPLPTLPEVTDAHRRAAFTLLSWPNLSFEQAMADDVRRKLINTCAAELRKRDWMQTRRAVRLAPMVAGLQQAQREARYRPGIGAQHRHATQPWPPSVQDLKRAAAGDLDDDRDD